MRKVIIMSSLSIRRGKMKKFIAYLLSLLISLFSISLMFAAAPVLASEETGQAGQAPPDIILYQEDFEDGDLAVSDADLANGLTWTADGSLTIGTAGSYDSKAVRMNAGASIISTQVITEPEYTVSFTTINWYNTPSRVMVAYLDERNYYSFSPTTGHVYCCMDGVETELGTDSVRRLIGSPRQNPSVNRYKVYFRNDGSSVTIAVDRDGYDNRKDYEFTYTDKNARAVSRFTGGRIRLARVDTGTSRYWVNFDDILVTKGKLQLALPRGPARLYVSLARGNDSFDGTEARPFKTIQMAVDASYPGDEIIVEDGLYDESVKFAQNRIYAEKGNRLVIKSRNRHKAVLNNGISLAYGDYATLDGFEVTGQGINMGKSTGAEVINNYIHDVGTGITAAGVNGRAAGNYILRCSFGITVSGTNMLVENNEIERLIYRSGDSDFFRFFGEGHIIRGNYMHGTRKEDIGPAHVDGFQTFDNNGEFARHIIIEGNFIEDFYHQGFMGEGKYYYHSYDIVFRNNIFKDAAAWGMCISQLKDVKVYNNLFINMYQHGVGYSGTDEKPATGEVRNNIFYNARNCYFGIDTAKYGSNNILFRSDPYQKYSQDSFPNDFVNVDPLFTDIDNDDYSLHPNSPAVDNGTSLDFSSDFAVNRRPVGKGWDIGPFEFQGSNLPVAYIRYDNVVSKNTGYEPFRVFFDGSDSYAPDGRSIVSYNWDFGDGSTGNGPITDHVFRTGRHTVRLTVTDDTGEKHTASQVFDVLPSVYPNLYLYLPFDGNSLDASGKNMTVTSDEGTIFENSSYGRSIRFNNNKSRAVSVSHSDYLDGLDEITISFFAKKDKKDTAANVVNKHTVYSVSITANGISGSINTEAGSKTVKAEKVVDDTGWHHYTITYDGSAVIAYVDGIERARAELSGRIRRDASRAVVIGRNPWGDSFEGLMDDFRIYDRALSANEIRTVIGGGTVGPGMAEELESLFKAAAIDDSDLNPTYSAMMRRKQVIAIADSRQNELRQIAKLAFSDIKGNEWYAHHIPLAVYRKLIDGYPDGTFRGGNPVTRAEFITMLARFDNTEETIKQKAGQDAGRRAQVATLAGDKWYTDYVVVSRDSLIYPDIYDREAIAKPMTRGEVFCAMADCLWKEDIRPGGKYYNMALKNETPAFSDTAKTIDITGADAQSTGAGGTGAGGSQWFERYLRAAANPKAGVPMDIYPAIICLKDKGILLGNNGESKWYDPISRAEALALFERLARVWSEESN